MDPNVGATDVRGAALARGGGDNGNINTRRAAARAVRAAGGRGVADNGNVNAARAAAPAIRAAGHRGVADNGTVNAARAAAPAVHLPNIQARGAVGVHIQQPVPPDLAREFLSSMPDVNRSSLAELGSPAYRWHSVNEERLSEESP